MMCCCISNGSRATVKKLIFFSGRAWLLEDKMGDEMEMLIGRDVPAKVGQRVVMAASMKHDKVIILAVEVCVRCCLSHQHAILGMRATRADIPLAWTSLTHTDMRKCNTGIWHNCGGAHARWLLLCGLGQWRARSLPLHGAAHISISYLMKNTLDFGPLCRCCPSAAFLTLHAMPETGAARRLLLGCRKGAERAQPL